MYGSPWEAADATGVPEVDWLPDAAARFGIAPAGECVTNALAGELLPERWARRYRVAPLAASDSSIVVATADPHDLECERAVAFATARTVVFTLASPRQVLELTERAYADDAERSVERQDLRLGGAAGEVEHLTAADAASDSEPQRGGDDVMRLVDGLLAEGIRAGASDVHVEPEEQEIVVRHRVDGVLRDVRTLPRSVASALASRVKILSGLNIADRLRPQDGRTRVAVGGRPLDLRVSTLPAAHGEKIVIRILDATGSERSLDAMGFSAAEHARVGRLLEAREGLILVTGPTGSGKTTTLYAALRAIKERGVNIVTVEDPIEYRIPGIVQVQVRERSGLTFAAALRSIMRQDPDVILIGEIRDRETAEIAIQASLTGHLVLSTLHTNDAASAATRLADMGVPPVKVATALKGVVAQRLLRRACAACAVPAPLGPRAARFGAPDDAMAPVARGCAECGGSGYRGRLAVVEVLLATPEVERAIASGVAAEGVATAARQDGMASLWESGMARVLEGVTTVDELLRVAEPPPIVPAITPPAAPQAAPSVATPASAAVRPRSTLPLHCSRHGVRLQPSRHAAPPGTTSGGGGVTEIKVGTIDVYVIRALPDGWRVLLLQRAHDTRCPTAWESVHGRLEPDEEPEVGALRELREETGLVPERFYVIATQPYYIKAMRSVQLSIAFAAFVAEPAEVTLGPEHQAFEWVTVDAAMTRFAWPRERQALDEIRSLLANGDAGPLEDVLRVEM